MIVVIVVVEGFAEEILSIIVSFNVWKYIQSVCIDAPGNATGAGLLQTLGILRRTLIFCAHDLL